MNKKHPTIVHVGMNVVGCFLFIGLLDLGPYYYHTLSAYFFINVT
ncbi:hypothetical protein [Staphylococcus hyicus]|nr:hypothetical protein [Staphylococcus hyicus]